MDVNEAALKHAIGMMQQNFDAIEVDRELRSKYSLSDEEVSVIFDKAEEVAGEAMKTTIVLRRIAGKGMGSIFREIGPEAFHKLAIGPELESRKTSLVVAGELDALAVLGNEDHNPLS